MNQYITLVRAAITASDNVTGSVGVLCLSNGAWVLLRQHLGTDFGLLT